MPGLVFMRFSCIPLTMHVEPNITVHFVPFAKSSSMATVRTLKAFHHQIKASIEIVEANSNVVDSALHRLRADTGPRMHHGAQILPYEQVIAAGRNCKESQVMAHGSRPTPEDLSFIMYTSGTTGTPKGVILTQGGMVAAASALCTTVEVGQRDVHLSYLPMAHCFEVCVQIAGLICGASGKLCSSGLTSV